MPGREPLPIDPLLGTIADSLRLHPCLVLEAPPGAGKTTRVPAALLDAGFAQQGDIVVLEPRRIAARLAARRVAAERGERVGESIGYQVRFEDVSSERTRVRFLTEGILTRRLVSSPRLDGVSVAILDEFHERHLQTDLALALLRRLQQGERPDLRIVVMSATLDPEPISAFLGDCPIVKSEGRRFDTRIDFSDAPDDRRLESKVASAVRTLLDEGLDGDVLVFLPGAAEIRKARELVGPLADAAGVELAMLHGDLPLAEQDRAIARSDRRKIVLTTNVAETSVTVEGVVAVVDSGLARVAGHAPWSGLPTLRVSPISRASATQRAGRAGRLRPGRCIRLYARRDFEARPEHELPEIRRSDLADTLLVLRSSGVRDPSTFPWFEAPEPSAHASAETLLRALGAIDVEGQLTGTGREMLRYPIHPRLGRMIVEGARRGVFEDACTMAALLGERDLSLERRMQSRQPGPAAPRDLAASSSDLLDALELFHEAEAAGFDADRLRWAGIDAGAARSVERSRKQLARGGRPAEPKATASCDAESALLLSVLAGYPDRVAKRIRGRELGLAAGGAATLDDSSAVRDAEYLVAVDAEERRESRGRRVIVRTASAIRPDWLLDLFPDVVRSSSSPLWNPQRERVETVERLEYGSLVIEESRSVGIASPEASAMLAQQAESLGVHTLAPDGELERWLERARVVAAHVPEAGVAAPAADAMRLALRAACEGISSFAELRQAGILGALKSLWSSAERQAVESCAPERVSLPGGRSLRIHYEPGVDPWVESRLQDFFGSATGPSIARGRVPLVLHLLAPNQRAVQVTRDLAGFWERTYPGVRKELCRKYPKHAWPEDGRTASPPAPGRPRR